VMIRRERDGRRGHRIFMMSAPKEFRRCRERKMKRDGSWRNALWTGLVWTILIARKQIFRFDPVSSGRLCSSRNLLLTSSTHHVKAFLFNARPSHTRIDSSKWPQDADADIGIMSASPHYTTCNPPISSSPPFAQNTTTSTLSILLLPLPNSPTPFPPPPAQPPSSLRPHRHPFSRYMADPPSSVESRAHRGGREESCS